jgi:dienelactone hydrolase
MVTTMRSILLLAALALAGCSAAPMGAGLPLQIPVQPVANTRIPPNPLPARLELPPGPGPFPTVILLHGCGGIGRGGQLNAWVKRLNGWGYGALIVNSFGPRGVTTVCAPSEQHKVTAFDRAGDVINAALFLQHQPGVDPNRIGVIGFSHGGGTAVEVTSALFQDGHPGLLKAVVDYYGPCRRPDLHGTTPLLALAGDDDTWGPPAATCKAFAQRLRADQPFQVVTYPGTVHAFDNAALLVRTQNEGHPMQYNAEAATDSERLVHDFLDEWMASGA